MKFILNKDKLTIEREEEESPNSGSVKYYEIEVEHDESWEGLTIEARIIHKEEDEGISVAVINNKVYIDEKLRGQHYIGFIGYRIEDDVKTYQISSNLKGICFREGAGEIEVSDEDIPTPSQWEIYIAQIQDMLDNIETVPAGGTTGQVLTKKSNADGDVEWKTVQGGGGTGDHSELDNLDYEHSGHTGFQPAGNYVEDNNYVHTDNNYTTEEKTKLSELSNYDDTEIKQDISDLETNKADMTDIPDVSDFITKDVNNLTYYTLATNTGSTIDLSINSSTYVMTLELKNSAGTTISTDTVDLPLESVVVSGSYDDNTKKIILTLQSGSTVEFSVADLVSGLQSEITSNNKLSSDLVDDTNKTNKFVTTSEKSTWNAKYDKPSGGIPKTDLSSAVQTSLGKADTAVQPETGKGLFSGNYNDLSNKPTNVSAFTNDAGYLTLATLPIYSGGVE